MINAAPREGLGTPRRLVPRRLAGMAELIRTWRRRLALQDSAWTPTTLVLLSNLSDSVGLGPVFGGHPSLQRAAKGVCV